LLVATLPALPGCSKGCGSGGGNAEATRLSISVSIFPIYDIVRRIAGPDADVSLLLPPGHNEHSFDPTPKDIESASKAKVAVMVGLGLDPWMEKLMAGAAPKARIVKVGDRVPTLNIKDDPLGDEEADKAREAAAKAGQKVEAHDEKEHEKGATDPHVWLDPERMRLIVRAVAEELGKADSPHALDYRKRATEIDDSLSALDKEVDRLDGLLTDQLVKASDVEPRKRERDASARRRLERLEKGENVRQRGAAQAYELRARSGGAGSTPCDALHGGER